MRTLILIMSTAMALLIGPAHSEPFYQHNGIAIGGYDPVAYFTEAEAVPGQSQYRLDWAGSTWQFASAEHRDRFAAEPQRYAPQYGGHCAYAAGKGYIAGIDPEAWTVHNNRLYLNYSKGVRRQWLGERDALIESADQNWPALREQL